MGKLVKKIYENEKAALKDYERRHVKNAVYPGVIKSPGNSVQGVIHYALNQ